MSTWEEVMDIVKGEPIPFEIGDIVTINGQQHVCIGKYTGQFPYPKEERVMNKYELRIARADRVGVFQKIHIFEETTDKAVRRAWDILEKEFPDLGRDTIYPGDLSTKIAQFDLFSFSRPKVVLQQAYLYLVNKGVKIMTEEKKIKDDNLLDSMLNDIGEGLLIRLPFRIGTPVIMIMRSRDGDIRTILVTFELDHLSKYKEGFIFNDIGKAMERIDELRKSGPTYRSFFTAKDRDEKDV